MKKTLMSLIAAAALAGCHDDKSSNPTTTCKTENFAFVNKAGITYQMDLKRCPTKVDANGPSGYERLHFYEAPDANTRNINLNENIVLTPSTGTPFTHILQYAFHDAGNKQLTFFDRGTGTREVTYDGNNKAQLILSGKAYEITVNTTTGKLSIDQNADNVLNGMQAPIVDSNDKLTLEEDLLFP